MSATRVRPARLREADLFRDLDAEAERLARRHDPETSFAAARAFLASGKRESQHAMIVRAMLHGMDGATGMEFESALHFRAGRRLPELERAGILRRGEPRACTVTGEDAATWWLADGGATCG